MLQWAIRKATMASLVHNLKAKSNSDGDDDKNHSCSDWLVNEKKLFASAIQEMLHISSVVQVLQYKKNGERVAVGCRLRFWTTHRDTTSSTNNYVPDEQTPPTCIGITWQFEHHIGPGGVRSFSLADLEDLVVYDHVEAVNTVESLAAAGRRTTGAHTGDNSNPNYHRHCVGRKTKVVSFVTRFGHSLDLLACCVHDHGGAVLAIRDIILYQALQKKLDGTTSSATAAASASSMVNHKGLAVCGACVSIHHTPYQN